MATHHNVPVIETVDREDGIDWPIWICLRVRDVGREVDGMSTRKQIMLNRHEVHREGKAFIAHRL